MTPLPVQRPILGTILRWILFVSIAGAFLWYGAFQARLLIAGPSLTLNEGISTLHDTRTVAISGVAKNVTSLTLDGRPIFTDDAGNFVETLVLEHGYTIMTVHAEDRYGRTVTVTKPFVYTPAYPTSS